VVLLAVLFHYGARGDFLRSLAVATFLLRRFLDVLVLPLLLLAYSSQMLLPWHFFLLETRFRENARNAPASYRSLNACGLDTRVTEESGPSLPTEELSRKFLQMKSRRMGSPALVQIFTYNAYRNSTPHLGQKFIDIDRPR